MRVGDLLVTPLDDGIGRVRPSELYAAGRKADAASTRGNAQEPRGASGDASGDIAGNTQGPRGARAETAGGDAGGPRGAGGGAVGGGRRRGAVEGDWGEYREFLDGEGRLEMPVGTFLVRVGERIALVDAGYGPEAPATVSGPRLPEHLAGAGVAPGDVTDVILTHLHADHIGWCAVGGSPTFPRATYRCAAADWAHFVEGADDETARDLHYRRVAAATLGPIADRFETWTGEKTLMAGVDAVSAPGHTPGCSMIVLGSGGERAVLLGDVVHHPVQLLDDEWERVIDVDEAWARRTQIEVVRELIRDRTPVVGAHFPGLRFGRVVESGGRRQWVT